MRVTLKLFAFLRDEYGAKEVQLECGETLESLAEAASEVLGKDFRKEIFDDRGEVRKDRIILINGRNLKDIKGEIRLRDGDVVAVFPPAGGG